jgi:hypothetical protein
VAASRAWRLGCTEKGSWGIEISTERGRGEGAPNRQVETRSNASLVYLAAVSYAKRPPEDVKYAEPVGSPAGALQVGAWQLFHRKITVFAGLNTGRPQAWAGMVKGRW